MHRKLALLATALVAALARGWPEHREALIGLLYVACACSALLVSRGDAHGAEHLHALLAADVLWSDWPQASALAACACAVTLAGRRLRQDKVFFLAFALVASVVVQVLGLFIVFAALIAPGLWRRAGWSAPAATALAVAAALAGLGRWPPGGAGHRWRARLRNERRARGPAVPCQPGIRVRRPAEPAGGALRQPVGL